MSGLDAIVCGSVAVTRDGRRCGKGEGYSDLEFAILRELGYPPVPVGTTVHDLQVVASVPRDPTDHVIATPTHTIRVKRPSAAPMGIDWARLSAEDLQEMPVLEQLKRLKASNANNYQRPLDPTARCLTESHPCGHRQLVRSDQPDQATGRASAIYWHPVLQISAQTWNFWVLEALCSAAVTDRGGGERGY
jgi:hypothetical protein